MQGGQHDTYAAAAVRGLSKSTLSSDRLFEVIIGLEQRGFTSDAFRDDAASAIQYRASRQEEVPPAIAHLLEDWLNVVLEPHPTAYLDDDEKKSLSGPVVFNDGVGFGLLTHGRGSIARAIAAVHSRRQAVNARELTRILSSRAGKERNPRVVSEMLAYFLPAFEDKTAATAAYEAVISICPQALGFGMGIHAMMALAGGVDPPDRYENWLDHIARTDGSFAQQEYAELLFLYCARTRASWADDRIAQLLKGQNVDALRGLAFAAAEGWLEPHCRSIATDILCVAARNSDGETSKAINRAFTPPSDARFPLDSDSKRLIRVLINNPDLLRQVADQIMDAIAPSAGIEPAIVAEISQAVLNAIGAQIGAGGNTSDVAGSLTSAAITLHRQPAYRAKGLDLFEQLIRLGVQEAQAALELIDRRPIQSFRFPTLQRPRRRRRPS
jgi:hypothetical protein